MVISALIPNLRGTGQLRAVVNLAPSNTALLETNFSNNISPINTITFTETPPIISLATARTTIRSGGRVDLEWQVQAVSAISCELSGGGMPVSIIPAIGADSGTVTSREITGQQTFTLICTPNNGLPAVSSSVVVSVIPRFEEV